MRAIELNSRLARIKDQPGLHAAAGLALPGADKLGLPAAVAGAIRFEANTTPKAIDERNLVLPRVILVIAGLDKAALNEEARNIGSALHGQATLVVFLRFVSIPFRVAYKAGRDVINSLIRHRGERRTSVEGGRGGSRPEPVVYSAELFF